MFRLLFTAIITMRVIFCPVLCMGCGDGSQTTHTTEAHTAEAHACCSGESTPCEDGNSQTPVDYPCPCESGDCQVITDLNNRAVEIDIAADVTIGFLTISCERLSPPQEFGFRGKDFSHRLDLTSGWAVRLAHASLLL